MKTTRTIAAISLLTLSCGMPIAVHAQGPASEEAARAPQSNDRDATRERLERMIAQLEERRAQAQNALQLLDQGAPIEEVREAVGGEGRGRDFAGWGRERSGDRPPLNAEDIPRLMKFIASHNPDLAANLRELSEKDPEAFQTKLTQLAPRVEHMIARAEKQPGRFGQMMHFRQIDHRARRLARAIVDSEGDTSEMTLELRKAVAEGFDVRLLVDEDAIAEARARLDEMERERADSEINRERMIDERVQSLLEEAESGEPPAGERRRGGRQWEKGADRQPAGRRRGGQESEGGGVD